MQGARGNHPGKSSSLSMNDDKNNGVPGRLGLRLLLAEKSDDISKFLCKLKG